MPAADHRLTTLEMAQFVTDGYLRFDGLIPYDLNRRLRKELTQLARRKAGMESTFEAALPQTGTPLSGGYPDGDAIREFLDLPHQVQVFVHLLQLQTVRIQFHQCTRTMK